MRVGVLGSLEVVTNGTIVEVGGARLRTLLIRLALDAGRTVTVDSLSYSLWPDGGPADQANALQSLVSRLRRVLPNGAALRSVSGGYRLDIPPDAVDALRFERLAGDGRRALREGNPAAAARQLREALALWRGEALADVASAPFAATAVVRLDELRLAATEDRIEAELETANDLTQPVVELGALAAAHPLRERVRVLLITALQRAGRQAEALASYEEYRRLLADELGADPGPELQDVHLAMLRGEQVGKPVRSTRSGGNLREPLTSFVGRDEEQRRVSKRLAEVRLITLVGPGGVGKTRLATAVAAAIAGEVPGGAWLADLMPVTHPSDVPHAVAAALGLRELAMPDSTATPRDATSRLAEALSATETLLVLDNCEQVIDGAAQLADHLLGRCPRLRIVATSREPLGITGETLWTVPPLELPESSVSVDGAVASPAVRLFADRATAARPDFAVTDDNVRVVVEICRRLDGLPLALELAAARLRSLSVHALAARLGNRLGLLTAGSRTAPPRHRTLRDVIAWSWDLLDDIQRRLAERLAVFPGSISLAAAEWMSAPTGDVLETVAALVDKSLLQVIDGPTPRYRMLETIREYGQERLADSDGIIEARSAHAAYFLHLAEAAEPHLCGTEQALWIHTLLTEHDNMLAALHYAHDTDDGETAVRLAAALGLFWTIRGNHAEAAGWLQLALNAPNGHDDARAIATVFYVINAVLAGSHPRGGIGDDELNDLRRTRMGDHPALALVGPAVALMTDDLAAGLTAIDLLQPHPDPWARAMLWFLRSFLQANSGDLEEVRNDLTAAAEAFAAAGERWGLTTSLTFLAYTETTLGDFDGAIEALEEAIRQLRILDPADEAVLPRVLLAEVRVHRGDFERARAELQTMARAGTAPARDLAAARIALGDLARYNGDLDEAGRQYDSALAGLDRDSTYRALAHSAMGHLTAARGDGAAAARHLAEAYSVAVQAPDLPLVAVVGVGVARLCASRGEAGLAAQVLGAAHALRGAPAASHPDVARLTQDLGGELGQRAFRVAYDRGRGLGRTDALALINAQVRRR